MLNNINEDRGIQNEKVQNMSDYIKKEVNPEYMEFGTDKEIMSQKIKVKILFNVPFISRKT
jgi:hypothetical protein